MVSSIHEIIRVNKFDNEIIAADRQRMEQVLTNLLSMYHNGADGRDICKNIKQTKDTQHIPIILFSANAKMRNNFQACHAEGFIAKSFELAHLLETIWLQLN